MVTVDAIPAKVVYGAAGIMEVMQNVRTILGTRKGTVPLDRSFGIDFSFLDDPLPLAQARLKTEVFQQIRKYEPRAILREINFSGNPLEGQLYPNVKIEVDLSKG